MRIQEGAGALGAAPIQPRLAVSNLFILEGAGPGRAPFNEIHPLRLQSIGHETVGSKTARKIHLVFEQDENGRIDLSTTEGSMKEAKEGMFPHHADHILDMAALSMMTMEEGGQRSCCIRINGNHYSVSV